MEINIGDVEVKKKIDIGDVEVGIKKVYLYPELEDLSVVPSLEDQTFKSSKYGFDTVEVKKIETEELNITPSMEEQVDEGLFNKVTTKAIESDELTVIPTKEEQSFEGLFNKVTVEGADINTGETSGGIKQFATEEEMQADETAQEGDLAVVYGEAINDLVEGQSYDTLYCPKTIVFDTAITSTKNIYFSSGTNSFTATHWVRITTSVINFYKKGGFSGTVMSTVKYSSSDGITYTRTDTNAEIMTIAEIYSNAYSSITVQSANIDLLNQMFKAKSVYFGGLFKGEQVVDESKVNFLTNFTAHNQYVEKTLDLEIFEKAFSLLKANWTNADVPFSHVLFQYIDDNNIIAWGYDAIADGSNRRIRALGFTFKDDGIYFSGYTATIGSFTIDDLTMYKFEINLAEQTVTQTQIDSANLIEYTWGSSTHILLNEPVDISYSYMARYSATNYVIYFDDIINNATGGINSSDVMKIGYNYAPTQLSATNEYVYDASFYGANGLEEGIMQNTEELSKNEIRNRAKLLQNLNSQVLTPVDTDFSNYFSSCSTLTTIPQLDTSNVTNMYYMFSSCSNLTEVPLMDTSNVTSMAYMFFGCSSLTTIPEFDTANVTTMAGMFYGCTKITNIPQLDTSNVTTMVGLLVNCGSYLTNESFNNILGMCINAINYTGPKTLQALSFSESQATTCTGLSNYQAFLDAGWTTGY